MTSVASMCLETVAEAFEHIKTALNDGDVGLIVVNNNSTLEVTLKLEIPSDEEETPGMVIKHSEIPCFMDTIPELFTSYVVAQLLKVATTEDIRERRAALALANSTIHAKITVLHELERIVIAKKNAGM